MVGCQNALAVGVSGRTCIGFPPLCASIWTCMAATRHQCGLAYFYRQRRLESFQASANMLVTISKRWCDPEDIRHDLDEHEKRP